MGFLFSSKKKERTVVIFDIGSGSVGGAIVCVPSDSNSIPLITKSVRNDIRTRGKFNFSSFTEDMIFALNKTASSLLDKKVGAPDEIICVMASPWYISETITIKTTKEKPFTFNKKLAGSLIKQEISNLTEDYKNKYDNLDGTPEVIELHTMSVLLNGYVVDNPLGKKCNFAEMNVVISLSPRLCLEKIREEISKTFHNRNISFSSFTLDTYLAVRDKYISPDSYLLIDISGEITDVGIVTKGILKSVLSFPFGKKNFYKYLCSKLDVEMRDAKEIFKLYNDDKLSEPFRKKMDPIFKSIEGSWGEAFEQCINTLPRTLALPGTIFLTSDEDIKKWFSEVLKNEEHLQSSISDHKCTVVTLDGPEFLDLCDIKGCRYDPFLMIEAIAAMRKNK